MAEYVCVVCPRGCALTVGDGPDYAVTGNACPRGAAYGRSEATDPKRTMTATCRAVLPEGVSDPRLPRRVPVRTTVPIPRARVGELVAALLRVEVTLPTRVGDVVIADWEGTGASVIVTRDIALTVE
ncbi:MAG TPA: DUF1667 domain-containing protein [Treponemataceae bacterium]|nr:DUF1667 domain-containing protein [Treponemataceae bacterium]